MPNKRISLTITEVCKQLGINYTSCNKDCISMIDDAKRLGEIYRDLKIIAGDLDSIADRHECEGLKKIIHKEAMEIDRIDHELIRLTKRIKND